MDSHPAKKQFTKNLLQESLKISAKHLFTKVPKHRTAKTEGNSDVFS
jgi:hypothetical protein